MGLKLNEYINEKNRKLTSENIRCFLIDYGFTDLQLTKDSDIQAVPLTNEAYEKELKGESNTTYHIPHLTNIKTNENIEEPMKFIKRIAKERE